MQNLANGDINGTTVVMKIEVKNTSSSTWINPKTVTFTGKTNSPYERSIRIERPPGSGTWDIRVTRMTADASTSNIVNATSFARFTELDDVKLEYPYTAYCGIAVDAEATGGNIPRVSYLTDGIKVQVPVNYDPVTRTYSGIWNGSFKRAVCDNPAWVLYDLLTNDRYGLGEFIVAGQIDRFSFYDAAVYSDVLVPKGNGTSALEPRFTFNYVINLQEDPVKTINMVAGSMRASVLWEGGIIRVQQDTPSSPVKLVSKANVLDGKFTYTSSPLQERHTVARVTWFDKTDRYLPRTTTTEDAAGIARYGYNPADVAAYGCTTEGQAIRFAKWFLYTELNQLEYCTFKAGFNHFDLRVGDVIKLYDEDYTNIKGAGKVIAGSSTTTVQLDRPVTITSGSKIDLVMADGTTIENRTITSANGLRSSVTVTPAFSSVPQVFRDYMITSSVAPRQFKIVGVQETAPNELQFNAIEYDPNKYSFVETGVSIPSPVYSSVLGETVNPISNVRAVQEAYLDPQLGSRVKLSVMWDAPPEQYITGYLYRWRFENGEWSSQQQTQQPQFYIQPGYGGTYDVEITAFNVRGVQSFPQLTTFTIGNVGAGVVIASATTLVAQPFITPDLHISFNAAATNYNVGYVLKDFELKIFDSVSNVLRRTEYLPAVPAGNTVNFIYTFAMNNGDGTGVPSRNLKVTIQPRDMFDNKGGITQQTFTNVAPPAPTGLSVVSYPLAAEIVYTKPVIQDYVGTLVWMSQFAGFTPSAANIVYDGDSNLISIKGLQVGTRYYFRVATYDTFEKDLDGSNLNLSPEIFVDVVAENVGGGASRVTSSGPIVLTSASARVQNLKFISSLQNVILPDATTMGKGGPLFIIKNEGTIAFNIRNTASELLNVCYPGASASVFLFDNSTSTGQWTVDGGGVRATVVPNPIITYQNTSDIASESNTVVKLSETKSIVLYNDSAFNGKYCVINKTGKTLSPSSVGSFSSTGLVGKVEACRLTDSSLMVAARDTSGVIRVWKMTVSGNTATVGTPFTYGSADSPNDMRLVQLDANRALLVYNRGIAGTNALRARVFDVTSGSVASGGIVTIVSYNPSGLSAVMGAPGKVVVGYSTASSTFNAVPLSISGSTISVGTPIEIASQLQPDIVLVHVDDANVIALTDGRATFIARDETTGDLIASSQVIFEPRGAPFLNAAQITPTGILVAYQRDFSLACISLTVGNNQLTVGPVNVIAAYEVNNVDIAAVTDTEVVVAYERTGSNRGEAFVASLV